MSKLKIRNQENELTYVTISDSYANKNTLDIYIKFLSLTNEEKEFIDSLKDKDILSLSQTELDKFYKIKTELNMQELFKKYKNMNCNIEEHNLVIEYFKNNPLKSYVRSRISTNTRHKAYKFIYSLSKEELKSYIEEQESKYEELTIYEAYVLFEAKETLYSIHNEELNERIRNERIERDTNLRKSLIRDYGLM